MKFIVCFCIWYLSALFPVSVVVLSLKFVITCFCFWHVVSLCILLFTLSTCTVFCVCGCFELEIFHKVNRCMFCVFICLWCLIALLLSSSLFDIFKMPCWLLLVFFISSYWYGNIAVTDVLLWLLSLWCRITLITPTRSYSTASTITCNRYLLLKGNN